MSSAFHSMPAASRAGREAQPAPLRFGSNQGADCRAYGISGQISASPWEGLYLEMPEESVDAETASIQNGSYLERFLTTLMVGE
jgi:hypothetical protein